MKPYQKLLLRTIKITVAGYLLICIGLYFFQEKLIFFPQKLDKNFHFQFSQPFEELSIITHDEKKLNGILFKTDSSKGLIFYLHGNAGSIDTWGTVAKTYTALHYDVFIIDYRGYGKSEGAIHNQQQFFSDMQTAYDSMKQRYNENKIIVLGYSIGTGTAAWLAAVNHPKLLILQAPYYSLTDMMRHSYSLIPTFLLKYKFETNKYLKECKMQVVIFHGDNDEVIYYGSSLKLKELFKKGDTLITLNGQGHNGITDNKQYKEALEQLAGVKENHIGLTPPSWILGTWHNDYESNSEMFQFWSFKPDSINYSTGLPVSLKESLNQRFNGFRQKEETSDSIYVLSFSKNDSSFIYKFYLSKVSFTEKPVLTFSLTINGKTIRPNSNSLNSLLIK